MTRPLRPHRLGEWMSDFERSRRVRRCEYCAGEPEPGRIETPNNGPIVECPICKGTGYTIPQQRQEPQP